MKQVMVMSAYLVAESTLYGGSEDVNDDQPPKGLFAIFFSHKL